MLFLTDVHLDEFRQWSSMSEGFNTRLLDQINAIAYVGHRVEEMKAENVIFLGDLFNSFSPSLPKTVYNAAYHFMATLSAKAQLYVIAGNHDVYRGRHLFDPYRHMENVHIITSPVSEQIEGYMVDMVPWGYDIKTINPRGDILAAHAEIRGARMNASGTISKEGLGPEELRGYKYVFLGHYHEAQRIDVPGAKLAEYIGSLTQIDLSSSPYNKGITWLHCNLEEQVVFEEVPSPKIYTSTIRTQQEADELAPKLAQGDYWRVTVCDPGIQFPNLDHRVQIEYDIAPKTDSRLQEKPGEDLRDTIMRFIDSVDTKIDKSLAKTLLDDLM